MENYNIVENSSVTGSLLHQKVQQVVTSGKSPWVAKPGSRSGKVLQLRQNAFDFYRRELGPGYDFYASSSDINQPRVAFTSTNRLGQFAGWTQFGGIYTVPYEEQQTAVARWYGDASSFATNVAEIYATRKQTIKTVGSMVFRIANAAHCIKKRNWRGACTQLGIPFKKPTRKNRNNIPEAWLEYNYAWKPLLSDIYLLLNDPFPLPYRVLETRYKQSLSRVNTSTLSGTKGGRFQDDIKFKITVRGKVTVNGTALAAISSFGVTNPLSLAWELLPFSFVVDWLLPIGSYLEQLTALGGCTVSEKSTTTTVDVQSTGTGYVKMYPKYSDPGFSCKATYHRKTRVLSFVEKPFPQLKNPLSIHHFSLAMSLLTGAMKDFDKPSRYPRR